MNIGYGFVMLLVALQLTSCDKKDPSQVVSADVAQQQGPLSQVAVADARNDDERPEAALVDTPQALLIYPLGSYEKVAHKTTGFVPLTDSYTWDGRDDSNPIAPEYLGDKAVPDFHLLSAQYRARFLQDMQIKETDTVFIYHYRLDSISEFSVTALPLLAHISYYGADLPISPADYLIGFDLQDALPVTEYADYYDAFVYVGSENPFETGNIKPIVWEKVAVERYPHAAEKQKTGQITTLHMFNMNHLDYYLLNSDHLVIVDGATHAILSDSIFAEGESASVAPLSFTASKDDPTLEQWTGSVFKNKAPVYFGFIYQSFGCASIDFIGEPEQQIVLRCDNRH